MKQFRPARLGICGYSGSGKTTLIEQLLPILQQKHLHPAVIKHHNEPVQIDQPGSDTDRFYRTGAAVLGYDGQMVFIKSHQKQPFSVDDAIARIGGDYDLVLIEGFKHSDIDKIWLLRPDESEPPSAITNIIATLKWNDNRLEQALAVLGPWLKKQS